MKIEQRKILIHLFGCVLFLSLPVLFSRDFDFSAAVLSVPPFQRDFISYFLLLLFFYFHFYVLLPRFYFQRKYLQFALLVLSSYLLIAFVPHLLIQHESHGMPPMNVDGQHFPPPPMPPDNSFLFVLSQHFFQFLMVIGFSFLIKLNSRLKQTEQEKLKAELSYLKAQINPHFLFNTLNSIYSSAIGERAHRTATAVVKLSGMMRYVFTDTHHDYVSLEKELSYISDYIELQRLRLDNTIPISYTVTGNVLSKKIAPLILIAFIENAFKYGVNAEENSSIIISIVVEERKLTLTVKNNKVHIVADEHLKSGLGIENTKHRLELLYPFKHELKIAEDEKEFHIYLSIDLA